MTKLNQTKGNNLSYTRRPVVAGIAAMADPKLPYIITIKRNSQNVKDTNIGYKTIHVLSLHLSTHSSLLEYIRKKCR